MAGVRRRWARGGVIGAAVAVVGVAAGVLLLAGRGDTTTPSHSAPPPPALASTTPAQSAPTARRPGSTSAATSVASAAEPVAAEPAAARPTPALAGPIVAEGRTALAGGLYAVRAGDTVEVHFDTPSTRTRRPEKFERIVRETLPAVYGTLADDALADVPAGQLVDAGELLVGLPERGVRLRTAEGGTLVVWPATRPGRDGPLVITYRATILQ